jgi:hypothetical protein
MIQNDAHIKAPTLASNGDAIAPHWDLELQESMLDVAAVMAATMLACPECAGNSPALTLSNRNQHRFLVGKRLAGLAFPHPVTSGANKAGTVLGLPAFAFRGLQSHNFSQ